MGPEAENRATQPSEGGKYPVMGARPVVQRMPAIPEKRHGSRMLPPRSAPISMGLMPAAIAAAPLPPGVRARL